MTKDSPTINQELSGLMDITNKEIKKFIKDFIDRIEQQRAYE